MTNNRLLAVGVDGAPGGWLAACCFGPAHDTPPKYRRTDVSFFGSITELARWRADQRGGNLAPVGVDIPIGLPDTVSFRACDSQARERLGERRSSVFHPPARYLLAAAEPVAGRAPTAMEVFARVKQLVAERRKAVMKAQGNASTSDPPSAGVLGLSRQGAAILLKVAEVDTFLRGCDAGHDGLQTTQRQEWLFEVHPELCFSALNNGTVLPRKATAHGQLARLDLVHREFPDAEQRIRAWEGGERHSMLDICDAYAACWTALRVALTDGTVASRRKRVAPTLEVLGEEAPGRSPIDVEGGFRMRIVV